MIDRRSLVLLALGGLALVAALIGALALVGIPLPRQVTHLAAAHGILMTFGFLGTMIALERAVALGKRWAFLAPLASGLGAATFVASLPSSVGAALILLAGAVIAAMYIAFDRVDPAIHTRTQAVGAAAWLGAALLLFAGRPMLEVVPWLAALLVLVIAGERLELSRLGRLSSRAKGAFVLAAGLYAGGTAVTLASLDIGIRLAGLGLLALTAWLAQYDVARRTVRSTGVTRFMAVCLLAGYGWLAVGGALWLVGGGSPAPTSYDAMLHAIFLGFVISMVFGHAPVIVPAVLRIPLPYRPHFYVHFGLLHAGLLLRIMCGDLLGNPDTWRLGGVLNVAALLVFVGSSAIAVLEGLGRRRSTEATVAGRDGRLPGADAGSPSEARLPLDGAA